MEGILMSTQVTETATEEVFQNVLRGMSALSMHSMKKLEDYIEELIDEEEEAADIAYIEAHKNDPSVPLSEIIKDYEAQHGPFRRV